MADITKEGNWLHGKYLTPLIRTSRLRKKVQRAVRILKQYKFDAIAFSGVSGALIAIPVALTLRKRMIVVRKDRNEAHGKLLVEGYIGARSYIIVDDFIETGKTVRRMFHAIKRRSQAKCLGVFESTERYRRLTGKEFLQ